MSEQCDKKGENGEITLSIHYDCFRRELKLKNDNTALKEKLKVAVECLKKYSDAGSWVPMDTFEKTYCPWSMAKEALAKIGEM